MFGRIVTFFLAAVFAVLGPIGLVFASEEAMQSEAVLARDEDGIEELATRELGDDDTDTGGGGDTDTGGGTNSFTSGVNSNDGTNSRVTPVTRDRDRSRGDLTRDRTHDGPGGPTRDHSRGHTNDNSRNDTRR
jgi:hypothetical protein